MKVNRQTVQISLADNAIAKFLFVFQAIPNVNEVKSTAWIMKGDNQ